MKKAVERAIRGFFSTAFGKKVISVGPWAVTVIVIAVVWQALPKAFDTRPISHYLITALSALLALVLLLWLRRVKRGIDAQEVRNQPAPLADVAREIQRAYRADPIANRSGWSHYLGEYPFEQTATPLSTAYGLQIVMLLGYQTPRVDVGECRRSILAHRNQDHGWSVQSQRGISRPEATAVIAAVIAKLAGHDPDVESAVATIRQAIDGDTDPLMASSTYVVATVLEQAPFLGLGQEYVNELLARLVNGAVRVDDLFYWTESLVRHENAVASTALTAQVVIALQAIDSDAPLPNRQKEILTGAIAWLEKNADTAMSSSEAIRYSAEGEQDLNAPRHFTAALVLFALLQSGREPKARAFESLATVWTRFGKNGIWTWEDGEAPTWMTFAGLRALIAWSVRRQGTD